MKNSLILLVILVLNFCVAAQDFNRPTASDYPVLAQRGKSVEDFVPKDWEIAGKSCGDLNADRLEDCALVIKAKYGKFLNKNDNLGSDPFDTNPRILAILFKDKDGYRIAQQSNTFILAPDTPTMEDPFQAVNISSGILQIDFNIWYSAGSWIATDYSYKFRFRGGEFVLIGLDRTESRRNSGETESVSYNFLTGKMKTTSGNFAEDTKEKSEWKSFKIKKLKTLSSFKKPLDWEAAEN